jgi:hypothetical protein
MLDLLHVRPGDREFAQRLCCRGSRHLYPVPQLPVDLNHTGDGLGCGERGVRGGTKTAWKEWGQIGRVGFYVSWACGGGRLLPAPAGTSVPAVTVPSPAASGAVVTAETYPTGEIIPAVSRAYFREKHNYRDNGRPADSGRDASGRSCACDHRAGQDVSCHIPALGHRDRVRDTAPVHHCCYEIFA